jgi:hypothetical protein
LEFGIAFHEALDVFYTPETWDSTSVQEKLNNAVEKFVVTCAAQRTRFLEATNQRELEKGNGDDYEERINLGVGMLRHHARATHPQGDDWFKPVRTEISFAVPLKDELGVQIQCHNSPMCGQTHENEGSGADVVYAGRIDMLVEDKRFGGYFVWDHKTASQLTGTNDEFLQLDDQVGGYCWALGHELGLDIKGFVYAEYRKAFPSPPNELKRMSGGRRFSTAATLATTIEVYEPFVREHDPDAYELGAYDEYLHFLRSSDAPKFHQRFPIMKTDRELVEIGRNISLEALDMIEPNLRIYPSVGRFSCGNCAYRQPCLGQQMGEDYQYTLDSLFNKVEYRYYHTQQEAKGDK